MCLPQCVYWLTLPDDDLDTFFLLGIEAAEADDMVEDTEFDESFLLMTSRAGQLCVVLAVCGVCCKGQSCLALILVRLEERAQETSTHALG